MPGQSKNKNATSKKTRRQRNPAGTRERILAVAGQILAEDGKEGLSVTQVARRAGINRGTAYQHFQTREQLIEAAVKWVSDNLHRAAYGDIAMARAHAIDGARLEHVVEHLANFAMENTDLGRAWLFELLSSRQPANDRFWQEFESRFEAFARSEYAQPGIDTEVNSVLILAGIFLWPVWARAHVRTAKERQQMATRFSREILRLCLHGTLRPEKYPQLDAPAAKSRKPRGRR